jgi:hypothetical protein
MIIKSEGSSLEVPSAAGRSRHEATAFMVVFYDRSGGFPALDIFSHFLLFWFQSWATTKL